MAWHEVLGLEEVVSSFEIGAKREFAWSFQHLFFTALYFKVIIMVQMLYFRFTKQFDVHDVKIFKN